MPAVLELTDAAQRAAANRWQVFPLLPGQKRPRRELVDWEHRATSDPDRIARWWNDHPHDNVAVACGPSGLVVVDLDHPKPGETPPAQWPGARHGLDVLEQLADRHGQHLERTWTVATPSGGRHLYYQTPPGTQLRNTSGRLGWRIDTRANGGYVVAADSVLPQGPYRVVDHHQPAELPHWIARLLTPPPPTATGPSLSCVAERPRYAETAIAGEVQRVLDAGPGARNWALNKAAWNLARLVAAGHLERADVEAALQRAGERAGYADGPQAIGAVIRAALNARLRGGGR